MTFEEIVTNYKREKEAQDAHNEKVRAEADKAKADAIRHHKLAVVKMGRYYKATNMIRYDVGWTRNLVAPLMEEVNRRTGMNFDTSRLCTFGLRGECPISAKNENGEYIASLTFTFEDDRLFIDTGERNNRYSHGTIGGINGFNNKTEEVTGFETIIENLKKLNNLKQAPL